MLSILLEFDDIAEKDLDEMVAGLGLKDKEELIREALSLMKVLAEYKKKQGGLKSQENL